MGNWKLDKKDAVKVMQLVGLDISESDERVLGKVMNYYTSMMDFAEFMSDHRFDETAPAIYVDVK